MKNIARTPVLSKKKAILFDYGDTLVKYYKGAEFYPILQESVTKISEYLSVNGIPQDNLEITLKRAHQENYESEDFHVRPLVNRLIRIFKLEKPNEQILDRIQVLFLQPIYSVAKLFGDAIPTLKKLKNKFDKKIAIVSNTPWGSPSSLWIKELMRFGLDTSSDYVDLTVFCTDVGWRKPSPQIFHHALKKLDISPSEGVFIGDNPKWDMEGPVKIKMDAILLDRNQKYSRVTGPKIENLHELFEFI